MCHALVSTTPRAEQAPLRVMLRYAAGRAVGVVGRQMLSVAVGWELYERTRSPLTLGLVGAVQLIPVFALFVPGGLLADRFDRRRLSAAMSLMAAVAALALAGASWSHQPLLAFYAALFALGASSAVQSPASSALLPMLVQRTQLQQANAIRSTAFQVASIAGPALAGLALAVMAPAWLYISASALSLMSAAAFWSLPPPRPAATDSKQVHGRDLWVGLRFIFNSPLLLPALTIDMFAVLFAGATALLPVFAKDVLSVGPEGLGVLRAAPAAGAVCMALLATRLPPWRRPGRVLLLTVVGYGVAMMGFGLSRSFWLSVGLLVLSGALDNISVIIRITLEQVVVPDEIRGRVGAVHYVFIGMSNELGELESGVAAQLLGPVMAVTLGGVVAVGAAAYGAARWRALRTLPPLHELKPHAIVTANETPTTALKRQ